VVAVAFHIHVGGLSQNWPSAVDQLPTPATNTMTNPLNRSGFVTRMSLLLLAATTAAEAQKFPRCCVCSDDCKSSVTLEDVVVSFPGVPSATCLEIQRAGQEIQTIPKGRCSRLDRVDFR